MKVILRAVILPYYLSEFAASTHRLRGCRKALASGGYCVNLFQQRFDRIARATCEVLEPALVAVAPMHPSKDEQLIGGAACFRAGHRKAMRRKSAPDDRMASHDSTTTTSLTNATTAAASNRLSSPIEY